MSRRSRVALLDVNVLVALFDPAHVHHEVAHDWFANHRGRGRGWATCPLTENGFVRAVASLAGAEMRVGVEDIADRLRTFTSSSSHAFWPAVLALVA